jgi:ribosomal protein L23
MKINLKLFSVKVVNVNKLNYKHQDFVAGVVDNHS